MTTLATLIDYVKAVTNRPDMDTDITRTIQFVTLKEHAAELYDRDLVVSSSIPVTASDSFRYSVDISGSVDRLRRIAIVREYMATLSDFVGTYGQIEFERRNVVDAFDSYGVIRNNFYSQIGNSTLSIKASRAISSIQVIYYQNPDVFGTYDNSSWIANEFPHIIVDAACAEIFKMIGKDDEAAMYKQKMTENRLTLLTAALGE